MPNIFVPRQGHGKFRRPIRGRIIILHATGGCDGCTVLPPANVHDPSGIRPARSIGMRRSAAARCEPYGPIVTRPTHVRFNHASGQISWRVGRAAQSSARRCGESERGDWPKVGPNVTLVVSSVSFPKHGNEETSVTLDPYYFGMHTKRGFLTQRRQDGKGNFGAGTARPRLKK